MWAWNSAIALVCGDTVVWKPSVLTPLTAVACQALIDRAAADVGAPAAVSRLVVGGREVGELLVDDPRVALVSATGSVRMGRQVGPRVAERFGRVLLELGGNNTAVVTPSGRVVKRFTPKVTGHVSLPPTTYDALLTGFEGAVHPVARN